MQVDDKDSNELSNNKIFELLGARFSRKYILYEHLHDSYNKLVDTIINYYYSNDNIFEENRVGDLIYRYKFKYDNIYIRPPLNENGDSLMYPSDARDRSTTYSIKFVGKITQIQEIYDLNLKKIINSKVIGSPVEKEVILGLPCMVRSKYCSLQINRDYNKKDCEYDPGGFFIVGGSEKFVLSQEKMVENKPLVFIKKDGGAISYKVKVNSRSPNPNIMMQGIEINLEKNYSINIKVPILNEVSVFVLMRALGLDTDREIVKYIVYNENDIDMLNILKISIDLSKNDSKKLILNKEDAYYSLTNKVRVVKKYAEKDRKLQYEEKKEHLEALLRNAFLPHIDSEHYNDVLKVKAYFLGYMVNKLLNCYLGRTEPDDRDSFVNKRIDMPGDLIFDLFKQHYKKMLNDCNKFFKKRNGSNHETPLNIINQIKPGSIEQGIKSSMMTGNWGKKKGVAQMYPRLTFLQSLSFLRRVDAPSGDSSTMKLTGPRHYHPSQVGFLCLTGDTDVLMYDNSIKMIKDIKNGDEVMTFDSISRKITSTKIKNWFCKNASDLVQVKFSDGTIIKCTPEHKFMTISNNGFEEVYLMKEVIKISPNENILKYDIQTNKFVSVKIVLLVKTEPENVYDFETELDTHNFIANGLCVSNCSVDSPEHVNIGLVKHLSLLGSICNGSLEQAEMIYKMLISNDKFIHINNHSPSQLVIQSKVFLNGEWIGMTDKAFELYEELRKLKQNGIIIRTNSIVYDVVRGEIKIYTDSGRLYRPLLRVKDNKILLTDKIINNVLYDKTLKGLNRWEALIEKYPETIEFIDMEEQYYMLVAEYKNKVIEMKNRENIAIPDSNKPIINRYDEALILNYTHCEFHPTMTIGIIAGNIPFANHNQGPRNIFQYAQGRQSMGFYNSFYKDRLDISYILYNTQKPLVNTKIAKFVHTDILPCGEQVVVALACYSGHNQDDSIIANQTSIERGLFRSISLKKHSCKIEKNQSTSQDDIFMKPDITKLTGTRNVVYDKLNDKGYVPEEKMVENGDVIIGKVTPIQPAPGSNKIFKDSSEIYKSIEPAIIDKVFTGIYDSEGYEMIKIRTRSERIPKIGDKFCIKYDPNNPFNVLTNRGWLKLDEIELNDKIATLVDRNKLIYDYPIGIYKFKYTGQMYKVRSQQVDLDVTMDHQMYIKKRENTEFELIEAKKIIGERYKFKKNCQINDKPEINTINIDGNEVDYDAYLELVGMFINNGSLLLDKNSISIEGEKRNINHLDKVCEKLKLKFSFERKEETKCLNTSNLCSNHEIESKTLFQLFKPLNVEAINKFLPNYVWDLNMRQARLLVETLISSNSSTDYNKQEKFCYHTSSKQLADDLMKLSIHAGWSASIKTIKEETTNTDRYVVKINIRKNEPEMNNKELEQENEQIEEIYEYEGIVGCLEVPSHVFMIRQNNKNVWIGNCCYTSDHDVLTFDGWKKINEITLNDKISCLINGNTLEYQNPTHIQEYDYDGELYRIKSNQVDLVVTPNHRMYVGDNKGLNYKIEKAEDIYGKTKTYKKNVENYYPTIHHELLYYYDNNNNKQSYPTGFILKNSLNNDDNCDINIINIDDWLLFFGILISEGFNLKTSILNEIGFNTNKQRVKDELTRVCEIIGFKITKITIKKDDIEENILTILDKKLIKYIKVLNIEETNKYLPDWVWYLTKEQSQTLIKSMLLCDENTLSNETYETYIYHTSSTQLADDFQKLCLHAGWSSNKTINHYTKYQSTNKVVESTKDEYEYVYRLIIETKQNNPLLNENIKSDGTGRQDSLIKFSDEELKNTIKNKVFCCSVKGDGIIYVRRNGYGVWCGQSRHGQKGVIGLTLSQSNMLFSEEGISPDLIVNPQALPSRMTVAQLIECLCGKVGAIKGMEVDGTSFSDIDIEKIKDILESLGYERNATEYLYNGITGERLRIPIFIGPTYYQRLKHLVMDKMHCLRCDKTEILFNTGWKKYGEFTKDDLVATLKDNKLVYEKPSDIFYYPDFNGKLYHVSNKSIEFDVSLKHRMWVSKFNYDTNNWNDYDFEYAQDIIGKERRYKKDAEWNVPDYKFILEEYYDDNTKKLFSSKVMLDEKMIDFLILFGFWLSYGSVNSSEINKFVCIDLTSINIDLISKLLTNLEFKFEILNINHKNMIFIYEPQLYNLVLKFKDNKYLPNWCFELSSKQASILLNSICIKHFISNETFEQNYIETEYTSNNKKLLDDLQHLSLLTPFDTIISSNQNNNWTLIINKNKNNTIINNNIQKDKDEKEYVYDYQGPLFCIQVSSGVFLTRTNGKTCWSGNSRSRGPITMLTHQPPEGDSILLPVYIFKRYMQVSYYCMMRHLQITGIF